MQDLLVDDNGVPRCGWCGADPQYVAYHDVEWGVPQCDDVRLFEKICLEGFQAGLSWLTILRKRERFREVFHGFEPARVARMTERDVERLLQDEGIVRHRGKIESVINNAKRYAELVEQTESLQAHVWLFAPEPPAAAPRTMRDVPASTVLSTALSRDLRKRGWSFVGPTTMYAFMQAVGVVNDHLQGCFRRDP